MISDVFTYLWNNEPFYIHVYLSLDNITNWRYRSQKYLFVHTNVVRTNENVVLTNENDAKIQG